MSIEPSNPDRRTILVLGGMASGKSEFAERVGASLGGSVCYVATADPRDSEMRRRIEIHRARRPSTWHTLEVQQGLAQALAAASPAPVVILESLGLLVANHLGSPRRRGPSLPKLRTALEGEIARFLSMCGDRQATVIVVSEEVGLGIVPAVPLARRFTDVLGWVNQQVAGRADEVYLVVAGIPIALKGDSSSAGSLALPTSRREPVERTGKR
jgi:adenosylcobinamide kinase/adenosylcobinamide-phosphate guanylyltransferase